MAKRLTHIVIYHLLGLFLALFGTLSVQAQDGTKPVRTIEVVEGDTIEFSVVEFPGDRYTWDIYSDSTGNFAVNQGDMEAAVYFENQMYEGATVRVINLPEGIYFLRIMVWDEVQCTNNLLVFRLVVINIPPIMYGDSVCVDEVPYVRVIFTGTGPWDFVYSFYDGVNTVNINGHTDGPVYTFPITNPFPAGAYTVWIMEVTNNGRVHTYEEEERPNAGIVIYPKPVRRPIYVKDSD